MFLRYIYPSIALIGTIFNFLWLLKEKPALKIPSIAFLILTITLSLGISLRWFYFLTRITKTGLYKEAVHIFTRVGYSFFCLTLLARLALSNLVLPVWPEYTPYAVSPITRLVCDASTFLFMASQIYVAWRKQEHLPKRRYYSYQNKPEVYKLSDIPENLFI